MAAESEEQTSALPDATALPTNVERLPPPWSMWRT